MNVLKMRDLDLAGKRLLIREDLNVPIKDGKVSSDARLRAALPTLKLALEQGAKVIVMSHLGRPTEGEFEQQFSMQPVADYLSEALGQSVPVVAEWREGVELESGQLVLLENVRFNPGEKKDDEALAKAYELQLYNEWLIKAQDGLKAYEPGKFPEIRKYALIPSEAAQQTPKVAEAMK